MARTRFVLMLATLIAILPQVWANPIDRMDLKGLPTIVVDGVTCTLPDAIQAANTDSTVGGCAGSRGIEVISLEADAVLTEASAFSAIVGGAEAGLPDITTAIVITGNDHTIERDASLTCEANDPTDFRLFNVLGTGALFLMDVTLRGGCVAPADGIRAQGGAIYLEGGTLELNHVVLENHRVQGSETPTEDEIPGAAGGALYCSNASITAIVDSSFSANTARGTDGRPVQTAAFGGAGYLAQCQVNAFEFSSVTGNVAIGSTDRDGGGNGGGFYFEDSTVTTLRHVAFLDNLAQGGDDNLGGSGNTADGGALYLKETTIQLFANMTFLRNQARGGNSSMSSGNRGEGGAIFTNGGTLPVISQSHFEDNLALGGDGDSPGNCQGGAVNILNNTVVDGIVDSLFRGNECRTGQNMTGGGTSARGGAIGLSGGEITLIERVTFTNNRAISGAANSTSAVGGAIRVAGSLSQLLNSTFDGNRAVGGLDLTPGDSGGVGRGGALAIQAPIGFIRGNTFVNNRAEGGPGDAGSGVGLGGAIYNAQATPVALGGNLFAGNFSVLADGSATPEDCREDSSGLVSEGWNLVEATGNCSFAATGDLPGVTTLTYPLADWGCQSPLPDGSCVPTVAIDESSPAIDQSSCTNLLLSTDGREVIRPFDLPAVTDADDGCDIGAFEAQDTDGDGFTEATDCAPDDPSIHAIDACGVCGGDSSTCLVFQDGFESGDGQFWNCAPSCP